MISNKGSRNEFSYEYFKTQLRKLKNTNQTLNYALGKNNGIVKNEWFTALRCDKNRKA